MDYVQLRNLLEPLVTGLKDAGTHTMLPTFCEELGLPAPIAEGSKRERMISSFAAVSDADLPAVARKLLSRHPPNATTRNQIQDILWSNNAYPSIPKKFRREVARRLNSEELYGDARRFDELLECLWILDTNDWMHLFGGKPMGLRAEIQQHVHRNPEDWPAETLFDQLGAYDASDRRFALFLEGLASAEVRPDETSQRHFVACVNEPLRSCGVELRETDSEGGYPVFSLVSLHAATKGRPKNLIFASPEKPDLRFRDALDNDVEIVTKAEKVLVYDRPIGNDGLRWSDLQQWWGDAEQIVDTTQAKRSLYARLKASLPRNSPPQSLLFDAFFEGFRSAVPNLPALLPEVWLHWDPRTVKERGPDALLRHRMDFLLLLPQGVRVVIEVDGKHHYADATGSADVQRYAQMVKADRELKLAGYEVFRFGAAELNVPTAKDDVKAFFEALFKRYGVPTN
ncbi:AbiJ-related protein [Diaphorobacter nitroreducens]|uniref:AbiJ-related protein n=1 Tax=Diaphorobacter nitroreducens TaxID=164759 RepID=UPI0035B414F3